MSTIIVINGSKAEAVYDDRFRPIFEALGHFDITRATDVEFDNDTREWVATHRLSGKIIARGPNRDQVIKDEVSWLEGELCRIR